MGALCTIIHVLSRLYTYQYHVCNVQLTFVDLHILVVWDMLEFFPFLHFPELLAAHPTLVAHRKHISELPRVKEYLAKRPQNPF